MSDKICNRLKWLFDLTLQHKKEHPCRTQPYEDGKTLISIIRENSVKNILELGTGIGYSSCLMTSAGNDILVDTIERNRTHNILARENISKLNLDNRIQVFPGLFENILPTLDKKYDFIFFDGFKPPIKLLSLLNNNIHRKGILFIANWQLLHEEEKQDFFSFYPKESWKHKLVEQGKTIVFQNVSYETKKQ